MKHSRQTYTQDTEKCEEKKHTHATIQHWPGAHLLHRYYNNYYADKFLFNMMSL